MVNRGEEEVWVQMNVVPRSTGNTNSGTRVNSLVPLFVFPVLRGTTFICYHTDSFEITSKFSYAKGKILKRQQSLNKSEV